MAPNPSPTGRKRVGERNFCICLKIFYDNYMVIFIGRSPHSYPCGVKLLLETRATRTTLSQSLINRILNKKKRKKIRIQV